MARLCYLVQQMNYLFEWLGSLLAGGGITWATYIATKEVDVNDFVRDGFTRILHETGPMEICAVGILVWILGKWRKHTVLR